MMHKHLNNTFIALSVYIVEENIFTQAKNKHFPRSWNNVEIVYSLIEPEKMK